MGQGEEADRVMPLEQYAAVTALIDSGRRRDEVLVRVGLSPQAWMAAQTHWLLTMAEQARLDRFELQNRFNDLLLEHLEAIEAGAEPVPEAGSEATGAEGEPTAGPSEPGEVTALPDGQSPPVAPPPVVPPASVVLPDKPGVVGELAVGGPSAAPGSASPWSDGSAPLGPPSSSVVGRPKRSTLSPFAAVAAPVMGRAVRSEGDEVLPFEPPPMPTHGGAASQVEAALGSEMAPSVVERPHVLPFSTATPGRTEEPSVKATLPIDEPVAPSAALPFAESPSKPQERGAGAGKALPFSDGAGAGAPKPPTAPAAATAPPVSVSTALPFEPAPVAPQPRQTAGPPDSSRPALPFQSPAEPRPASARAATPPEQPIPVQPPVAVEPPPPSVPQVRPEPPVPAPPAKAPAPVDLGSTMHVDADRAPKFVLPFAGSDEGGGGQDAPPASRVSADGALPFQSQPSAAAAAGADDAESLAGTVSVAAGVRLKAAKPRLSLEQFASLSAEIAVHPDQREPIEQRYGLDGAGHDREKGAWAVMFLNDADLAANYREKLSAFRAWLERKGSGS